MTFPWTLREFALVLLADIASDSRWEANPYASSVFSRPTETGDVVVFTEYIIAKAYKQFDRHTEVSLTTREWWRIRKALKSKFREHPRSNPDALINAIRSENNSTNQP